MSEVEQMIQEAQRYVADWVTQTTTCPLEDNAVKIIGEMLGNEGKRHGEFIVGKLTQIVMGEVINIELYDPCQLVEYRLPRHINDMPMQGMLIARRVYEGQHRSILHVGVNGELYEPGGVPGLVDKPPLSPTQKQEALKYFQERIKWANAYDEGALVG